MGYDRFPELLIEEKTRLLGSVEKEDAWIYYVHDPTMAVSKVKYDPKRETYTPVEARTSLEGSL
jgi:hypothetical protein